MWPASHMPYSQNGTIVELSPDDPSMTSGLLFAVTKLCDQIERRCLFPATNERPDQWYFKIDHINETGTEIKTSFVRCIEEVAKYIPDGFIEVGYGSHTGHEHIVVNAFSSPYCTHGHYLLAVSEDMEKHFKTFKK